MLVVDGHTHIFSPDMIRQRARLADADYWFGHLYDNPNAMLATDDDLTESMDAAGVQHSVACGFPWSDPGLCREHNAWLAEVASHQPGRISFLATVVPQDASAARDAEHSLLAGAVGVGELNADGQGFDLEESKKMQPLMEICKEFQKPVMLHASEPVGHGYPGKGTAVPSKLVRWIRAFQDQPLVLAHWGGGLPFYELMPEIAELTRWVFYDSAASTYIYNQRVFSVVASLVGTDRIIFGTDYPVLSQHRLIARTRKTFISKTDLNQIFNGTARRIYQLPVGAT